MSFDWRTEDEGDWNDSGLASSNPVEKKPAPKRRVKRWLLPLLLILVALLAAGWVLNRRVQVVTGQVERDVLSSHKLVAQAAALQDEELFQSMLSGRDADWAAVMMDYVERGELTDRSGLGLLSLPGTAPLTPTIEIDPGLQAADVTTLVPYAIEIGNGLTETVQLAQTAVYRLGANRWLISPPDADYWGGTGKFSGQYVTLFYPNRDKDIAQSLLLSLDDNMSALCNQFQDIDCPGDYRITVDLAADPAALSQMDWLPVVQDARQRQLHLATPTLVGLPIDQAGENALFRGYGQLVVTAALADLWAYDCCEDGAALFLALVTDRLRQLGLQPWPEAVGTAVSTAVYDELLTNGIPPLFDSQFLGGIKTDNSLWLPEDRAAALAAFAQEELALNGRQLVQGLVDLPGGSLSIGDWLRNLGASGLSARELEAAWRNFVYNQSSAAQQTLPAPLPEQDISLLCHMGGEERIAFYRYQLAEGATQLDQPLNREVSVMTALPDDSGLAVWEAGFSDELTSMFLWADGMKTAVSWDAVDNAPGPVPMHADPSGTKLLLAPADQSQAQYGLLDVEGCLGSACQLDILAGYPTWSPDLAHMILLRSGNFRAHMAQARGELLLADSDGDELAVLGAGASPFWLDAETYGYIMDAGEGRRDVILTGTIGGAEKNTLLTTADLAPDGADDRLRLFDFAALHPANPDWLVLVTIDAESDEDTFDWFKESQPGATLFVYDMAAQEVLLAQPFAQDVGFNRSYRFSPNGRFLLLGEGAEFRPTAVYILDIESGESTVFPLQAKFIDSIYWYTDFSQDGEWLLVMDRDYVHLMYPGSSYTRLIIPETGQCETAVFVNKND